MNDNDFDLAKYVRDNLPAIDAKPPKMFNIALQASKTLTPTPVFSVRASDNLCSVCYVSGSFDPRETWKNGIKENSRYFRFNISPAKTRYYSEGDAIQVELEQSSPGLQKFRKYTGPLDKILPKINAWIAAHQ